MERRPSQEIVGVANHADDRTNIDNSIKRWWD